MSDAANEPREIAPRRDLLVGAAISMLAALWCLLAVSPPLLEAAGQSMPSTFVRLLFAPICHQIPERSFTWRSAPLAVCARCTGLYAGFLGGCLALTALAALPRRRHPEAPRRIFLLLAALPCLTEWLLSRAGLTTSGAAGRAMTGALFTCTMAFYLLPALVATWAEIEAWIRRLPPPRETTHAAAS